MPLSKPDPWSWEPHASLCTPPLCTWLMLRKKVDAAPATIGSLIVWLGVALGTWALFLR